MKMVIFKSFIPVKDYNFSAQMAEMRSSSRKSPDTSVDQRNNKYTTCSVCSLKTTRPATILSSLLVGLKNSPSLLDSV